MKKFLILIFILLLASTVYGADCTNDDTRTCADAKASLDFVDAITVSAADINTHTKTRTKCIPMQHMTALNTNVIFGSVGYATTVVKAWCKCQGTCTTAAEISFETAGSVDMTTSDALTCALLAETVEEGDGLETFTGDNTLAAYETLLFDVDNTPAPTTDNYEICVEYTID